MTAEEIQKRLTEIEGDQVFREGGLDYRDIQFLLDLARGSLLDSERLDWLAAAGVSLDLESSEALPESYYRGELTLREAIDVAKKQ